MKKFISLLLTLFILSACANYNKQTMTNELNDYFNNLGEYHFRTNNNTKYFSYYLPSDTIEINFESENMILRYLNSKIALNINISSIINKKYFSEHVLDDEGFFDNNKLIYSYQGIYTDVNNDEIRFLINSYEYDTYMLIHFFSEKVNIFAYSLKEECIETSKHLMLLARGVNVEEEMYLANYSPKSDELYQRSPVDLFQYVVPEEGFVQDLLAQSKQ